MGIFKPSFPNTRLVRNNSLTSGLIGAYAFSEGNSKYLYDRSGYGNNAAIQSGDPYAMTEWGLQGNCLDFSGSQYAEVTENTDGSNATPARYKPTDFITISAWINISSFNDGAQIIGCIDNTNSSGYGLITSTFVGNKVAFAARSGGSFQRAYPTFTLTTGQWHHVAIAYRQNIGTTFFLDGTEYNTYIGFTGAIQYTSHAAATRIGTDRSASVFYNGKLESAFLWNRALDEPEIGSLYDYPYRIFDNDRYDTGDIAAFLPFTFGVVGGGISDANETFLPDVQSAGVVGGSTADVNVIYNETGTNGALGGSNADPNVIYNDTGSAGAVGGSAADNTAIYNEAGNAGVVGGSVADNTAIYSESGSAGAVGGSIADNTAIFSDTSTNGATSGGAADFGLILTETGSAGAISGGSADFGLTLAEIGSSGALGGSNVDPFVYYNELGTSGSLGGSNADPTVYYNEQGTSGALGGTAADTTFFDTEDGSGGSLGGSAADVFAIYDNIATAGATSGGQVDLNTVFEHLVTGGALGGSAADDTAIYDNVATGGVLGGGNGVDAMDGDNIATGGALGGSAADNQAIYNIDVSGGSPAGGIADIGEIFTEVASAGSLGGGTSDFGLTFTEQGNNGAASGSNADPQIQYNPDISGGSLAGGDAIDSTGNNQIITGGVLGGGLADQTSLEVETGSGGILGGSSADTTAIYTIQPDNGVLAGSQADYFLLFTETFLNGAAAGGSGIDQAIFLGNMLNGAAAGSAADITIIVTIVPSGGSLAAGTLDLSNTSDETPTGGIAAGSSADVYLNAIEFSSDGVALGGDADNDLDYAPSDGILLGGDSDVYLDFITFGGAILGGNQNPAQEYDEIFDGGITLGGAADFDSDVFVSGGLNSVKANESDVFAIFNIAPGSNGAMNFGIPDLVVVYNETMNGGFLGAGDPIAYFLYPITPDGGAVFADQSLLEFTYNSTEDSQGLLGAGDPDVDATYTLEFSGGITVGSDGIIAIAPAIDGGATSGGIADSDFNDQVDVDGGAALGGTVDTTFFDDEIVVTEIAVGGNAKVTQSAYHITSSGSISTGGSLGQSGLGFFSFNPEGLELTIGGEAYAVWGYQFVSSGGIEIDGSSPITHADYHYIVSKRKPRLTVSGSAGQTYETLAHGGAKLGGAAEINRAYLKYSADGSIVVDGSSEVSDRGFKYIPAKKPRIIVSGSAGQSYETLAHGGAKLGGTAEIDRVYLTFVSTGEIEVSAEATVTGRTFRYIVPKKKPRIVISGSASCNYDISAHGGAKLGGAAEINRTYLSYEAIGGISIDSASILAKGLHFIPTKKSRVRTSGSATASYETNATNGGGLGGSAEINRNYLNYTGSGDIGLISADPVPKRSYRTSSKGQLTLASET